MGNRANTRGVSFPRSHTPAAIAACACPYLGAAPGKAGAPQLCSFSLGWLPRLTQDFGPHLMVTCISSLHFCGSIYPKPGLDPERGKSENLLGLVTESPMFAGAESQS